MRYSDETPTLLGETGPLKGQRFPIKSWLIIGRDASCDIVIQDRQVSRRHARFSLNPRGVLLEDLGSKNGTHCNGHRVTDPVFLQDGDIIQVALVQQFVLLTSDATMPLGEVPTPIPEKIHGRLRLEKRSRRVWIDDQEILPSLSVAQFRLLEILYNRAGKVVPRRDLVVGIWGEEEALEVSNQALDAMVRRLRDRIAAVDPTHSFIVTVRGHGLRLENPPD